MWNLLELGPSFYSAVNLFNLRKVWINSNRISPKRIDSRKHTWSRRFMPSVGEVVTLGWKLRKGKLVLLP